MDVVGDDAQVGRERRRDRADDDEGEGCGARRASWVGGGDDPVLVSGAA
jgi:hypothetical protein